jgi:hypothetical protein
LNQSQPKRADPLQLVASAACTCCRGLGEYSERHDGGAPEPFVCDCALDSVADTPENRARIHRGDFEIIPSACWRGCAG